MRFFNTTGPCRPQRHYMLEPLARLPKVRRMVEEEKFFVVHAPRQSGKTTTIKAYAETLSAEGEYAAVYASCEAASTAHRGSAPAEDRILASLSQMAAFAGLPEECLPPTPWPDAPEGNRVLHGLREWAQRSPRPVVLFLDEIDALQGDDLVNVLRQLRDGHNSRPAPFPQSVAVCGMRDVRDYKAASGGNPERLVSSSPFNIKVSMRLADFTYDQVAELYGQHTEATGQEFEPAAVGRAFEASQGQPWLVNALAYDIISERGITGLITDELMDEAVERLIRQRATHLDSLAARLYEPRVKRIIEPMLAGLTVASEDVAVYHDDVSYVRDLGLITRSKPLQIANPIYQEVITRVLAAQVEDQLVVEPRSFVTPDGRLDMARLVEEFAAFWRKDGEILTGGQAYTEAAAQLVFMGFLHRVVNGGGIIDREYALGRGRIDLCVRWPYRDGDGKRVWQWEAAELKADRPGRPDPVSEGLAQLDRYLDHLDLDTGVLIVFDTRPDAPPAAERTDVTSASTPSGRQVTLMRA
ncbi:AAA family ATPase [Nonomuraea turcica]|uniref:AAA family ATPase n=1 Tax=Nonomuraea sp. G32 TaxID=3067274 RepID=UPI00273CBB58|nr:AAA family ATPase [Nonomuraea sp. G32]MDP4506794.1 AAA family ATPase [Nonomuraea sp. G32]